MLLIFIYKLFTKCRENFPVPEKYTIFLSVDEVPKAYGVLALTTPSQEMIKLPLPMMVERLFYHLMEKSYTMASSSHIRLHLEGASVKISIKSIWRLNQDLESLPPFHLKKMQSDEGMLRFYLRNEQNREMYREEMERLINKKPSLLTLYYQEMGKVHARKYRKRLCEIGIKEGWFAILEDTIIASGRTRDEVKNLSKSLLPPEKTKFVYFFQLRSHARNKA